MSQTTYTDSMPVARKGMLADSGPRKRIGRAVEVAVTWGNVVAYGTDPDTQVQAIPVLPAADADAIATALASAATAQTFTADDFDGAVGAGRITPCQTITLTLNAQADWLATDLQITYETAEGVEKTDVLYVPAGGDVVLKTQSPAARVISIDVAAQDGTEGTIAVGTDTTEVALSRADYPGIAVYTPGVTPGSVADVDQYGSVDVLVRGCVWTTVEAAVVTGDPVYVRVVEDGTDLRGQVRGSAATSFARWAGARFASSADADALAVLEVL